MTDALISVRRLRIAADARNGSILLHDLSFDLAPGDRMAIVGESGSGKTLAARAMLGLPTPGVRQIGGAVWFEGRDIAEMSGAALRGIRGAGIGMVFQEPMTSLNPTMRIGEQLTEGLKLHRRCSDKDARRLAVAMLDRVCIVDAERCLDSFPHQFSGGMRQRIMLASVLLLKPRLLIADEPTTALDSLSQGEVMELMVDLTRESGAALLLITHDLGLVGRYTERISVLERGMVVEAGRTSEVLARPTHPYTAKLVGAVPRRTRSGHTAPFRSAVMLSVENVAVDYSGQPSLFRAGASKRVLHGIDLEVREGEIVALVGSSGSGKTTLGRAALGLVPTAAGRVRFAGVDIAKMRGDAERDFRRQAQMIFQDPFSSLNPRLRVADIVSANLRHVPGLTRAERRDRVTETLGAVGLADYADRLPHQMSGGQRQRVAIARAIVSRPRLIVADEPVSALDLTIQRQVLLVLQKLQHEFGFACLFITHDLGVVGQIANRVVVLEQGMIVEDGSVERVFADPAHTYTRALLAATPSLMFGSQPT